MDLKEVLKDAHAYFFLLTGERVMRLKLWEITKNSIIIDRPSGAPMRKTVLGYIPTITGDGIFEFEGKICAKEQPDQIPNTIVLESDPSMVRKVNRRLYPRYSFTPPLDAKIVDTAGESGASIPCRLINISAGGLRIETQDDVNPTKLYRFEFEIDLGDEVHTLSPLGTIVYELPSKTGRSYGVRFGKRNEDHHAIFSEANAKDLDRTIDLMELVNRLIIRQ